MAKKESMNAGSNTKLKFIDEIQKCDDQMGCIQTPALPDDQNQNFY